jgi:hypothetical protein
MSKKRLHSRFHFVRRRFGADVMSGDCVTRGRASQGHEWRGRVAAGRIPRSSCDAFFLRYTSSTAEGWLRRWVCGREGRDPPHKFHPFE